MNDCLLSKWMFHASPTLLTIASCMAALATYAQQPGNLENGSFEKNDGKRCERWRAHGTPYALDSSVKHDGSVSIRCESRADKGCSGVMQELVYEKPDMRPIFFSGWSKSDSVSASEYCIYLDIWYEGGGNAWGICAHWNQGTHDWQKVSSFFQPKKPVSKIQAFYFLRSGTGTVWFDDLQLERREATAAIAQFSTQTMRPFSREKKLRISFEKKVDWSLSCSQDGKEWKRSGKGASLTEPIDDAFRSVTVTMKDGAVEKTETVELPTLNLPKNTVPSGESVVWTEDSMTFVTPLTFPTEEQKRAKEIRLELARRERESAQILISTADDVEWHDGSVTLPELRMADGTPFAGTLTWEREGYLARDPGYRKHPCAKDDVETWFPDPLLPAGRFRVPCGATQGIWLTFHAADQAKPGVYKGDAMVLENGRGVALIPLTVRVYDFRQPDTIGMPTAFCVMDGFTRNTYPDRFAEMKRQSHDRMLDARLNADDISRTQPPAIEDLLRERERGMNRFNILNIVPPPSNPNTLWVCYSSPKETETPEFYEAFKARLTPYVQELRKHDLMKYAYIYGFDEREKEYYKGIDEFWKKIRRDFPDLPVMTTAMMYRDMTKGVQNDYLNTTDWFCPLTPVYKPELNEKLRKEGKQVWWYVCCGPTTPYANFASYEYPLIEGRLLGWMTHLYRSDGLLYWHVNWWPKQQLDENDCYFPQWKTGNGLHMPGDGILLYPGKKGVLSSIRIAQVRDGVEDYEWLQQAAARGAEKADAVSRTIIQSMTKFTRSPAELRHARRQLADLILSR
ncbi:MAG: DUF4091 domain-containing protein [Kiritimatiellae bacterium]|nr:DUF4091 domain-containing protein [Kiritimatiellia bacterium]